MDERDLFSQKETVGGGVWYSNKDSTGKMKQKKEEEREEKAFF